VRNNRVRTRRLGHLSNKKKIGGIPMRSVVVFLLLISSLISLSAQTDDSHHSSVEPNATTSSTIDGAVHPEQVPDADAYRLVLITVACRTDASPHDKATQLGLLNPVGLNTADLASAISVLAAFKTSYEELIKTYNASAELALANGQQADINGFLVKRDALVEFTRKELRLALTPEGATAFDEHVQTEKKNMVVTLGGVQ
jgi:hypothetical protein